MDAAEGIDLEAAALLWYEDGISAQLLCTIRTEVDKVVRITGSEGIHPAARRLSAGTS